MQQLYTEGVSASSGGIEKYFLHGFVVEEELSEARGNGVVASGQW